MNEPKVKTKRSEERLVFEVEGLIVGGLSIRYVRASNMLALRARMLKFAARFAQECWKICNGASRKNCRNIHSLKGCPFLLQ